MRTRVGIMTMQRIRNYGSSLQAYGLRRLVEGAADGALVTFVDYTPGVPLLKDEGTRDGGSDLGNTLRKAATYARGPGKPIDRLRFLNHKKRYARAYYPLVGIPAELNLDTNLDVQIIGSDEVFNCVQSNTRVGYSRDLFGFRSNARRVVSYAGSFGNTTLDRAEAAGIRDSIQYDLSRLNAISVRDENSASIVSELLGERPPIHVDPALAYDFMAYENRIPSRRLQDTPYVVVYGYPGRFKTKENEAIRDYARRIDATVLCLGGVQDCGDRFVDCDPFELLAYFRDAEAVVSDTFHGAIFALINQRPFAAIVRESEGHSYGNEEKVGYLLRSLGVTAQRATNASRIAEVLANEIDYASVQQRLEHERARTREYLLDAVL